MVEYCTSSERENLVDPYSIVSFLNIGASLLSNVLAIASQVAALALPYL